MNAPVPTVARLDLTTAQEVMHAGVVACDPASPLAAVAWILADEQIHCVVVRGIERARDGERLTWGTVSDRDLIRALARKRGETTAGRSPRPSSSRSSRRSRSLGPPS